MDRKRQPAAWGAGVLMALALGSIASGAVASDIVDYNPYVPNALVNDCVTCHQDVTGIDVNPFGLDVQNNKGGDGVPPDWAAVCNLDSDGDGQTNGQELGDPCCEWSAGAAPPRSSDISNPGEASSMAADPAAPGCTPEEDDDGCSVAGGMSHRPAGVAAALVAALLLGSVCRRRQTPR